MRQQAAQEGLVPLKAWVKNALDHVIRECMNEPGLEFVWVGDDAIDPLEQAQTLQILVGAGIKTREEARADLGLAPAGGKAGKPQAKLGKLNPHHDERGQFATADSAVATVGSPARKPRPTPVQVASNDAVMSGPPVVTRAGGNSEDQATPPQMGPMAASNGTPTDGEPSTRNESSSDAGPEKPESGQKLKIVHEVPDDAVSYTTSDGTQLNAPPDADFRKIYAAGQANGQDIIATNSAVGIFGTYDFQRRNGHFYQAYSDASNYAVGVYMAGAGYSYFDTLAVGTGYSLIHSSNWESGLAYHIKWWTKGWDDATNGSWPVSHP